MNRNRKQRAMEERHLPQSSKHGKKNRLLKEYEAYVAKELMEKSRQCTEEDVVKIIREHKELFSKRVLIWKGSYNLYPWEIERDEILDVAKKEASKNWEENIAKLQDIDWYDFLESYAVAEFRLRNSPLYKML